MKLHIGAKVLIAIPLITVIIIIGVCIYGNTPTGKAEKAKNLAASAAASASEISNMKKNAVLDVTQFAEIKPDKLIKIMGKPSKTYKDKGDDTDTYYDYNNSKYWCEFTAWDGAIKKLQICSQKHENGKGTNFSYHENDDVANLKTFGVVEQYQPNVTYTGYALNLTNGITDTISEMKFQLISKDKKSFEVLWVNYC